MGKKRDLVETAMALAVDRRVPTMSMVMPAPRGTQGA